MSSAASAASGGSTAPSSSLFFQNVSSLGLGYAIAVALGVLVLLSAVLLASYVCCRVRRRNPNNPSGDLEAVRPRIIFVAEDGGSDSDGGGASATGLNPAAIASYPRFPYSAAKGGGGGGGGDSVCSICLGEYKEGEMMRMMPDCRHYFHLPCIDAWLRLNASCPVCRTSPMPTPLSTPLSELVPLSHYAADRRRRG